MIKKAIITGASSGIGQATAQTFLENSYQVLNVSRRPCPLAQVENIQCDLSSESAEDTILEHIIPWADSADEAVLIHNAATLRKDTVTTTSQVSLREVLDINILAANLLNQHILPLMKPGSSVIYVGSTLAEKAVANTFSYVISKHAVVGMMRATCQDLTGQGIHTACVCPGFTDTEMLRDHVPSDVLPALAELSSYGRLIEPKEIAKTLFWASTNPVINGSVIHANLGQIER